MTNCPRNSNGEDRSMQQKDDAGMGDSSVSHLESGRIHQRLELQPTVEVQQPGIAATGEPERFASDKPDIPDTMDTRAAEIGPAVLRPRVHLPAPSHRHRDCIIKFDKSARAIIADPAMDMSDSEEDYPYEDNGWQQEMAIRKSILQTIAGGTDMGLLMTKFTVVAGLFSKLMGGGGPGDDLVQCLTEDPADALLRGVVQEMGIQAAQNAGSCVASGTTTASTSTSMAMSSMVGAVTSSTPGSVTAGTTMMLATAAAVAALAAMNHQDVVIPVLNATTGVCHHDFAHNQQHELKQGYVRFGLGLAKNDILTRKRGELERLFGEVYLNVTGGCAGPYERLLQSIDVSSYNFEDGTAINITNSMPDDNNNNHASLTVYTSLVALVSCNGCLDHEPLFSNHNDWRPIVVADDEDAFGEALDTHQTIQARTASRGPIGNDNPWRRTLTDILSNTDIMQAKTLPAQAPKSTNTLFRDFVITYGARVRNSLDDQVKVFYGALLSPEGELVEEVSLRNKIVQDKAIGPEPRVAQAEAPIRVSIKVSQSPTPSPTLPPTDLPAPASQSKSSSKSKSKSSSTSYGSIAPGSSRSKSRKGNSSSSSQRRRSKGAKSKSGKSATGSRRHTSRGTGPF